MMDPEMMRLAQEQMSRIPPEELMKMQQQIMNNPELMRLAADGMKNLKPEDVKFAAEKMKHIRTEDMAEISQRMSRASPEEIAAMKARVDAQRTYELKAAQSLKKQGNQLHAIGKYSEAAEKYLRGKNNLTGIGSSEERSLQLACSLNLMSCYLKTNQYQECVQEGSEVLGYDPTNLKALYRRGQAYKELGKLELAVADFSKAAEVSPDDETVAQVVREAREELEQKEEQQRDTNGPIIEEITEEEADFLNSEDEIKACDSASVGTSVTHGNNIGGQGIQDANNISANGFQASSLPDENGYAQTIKTLGQNPDIIRNMQNLMSNVDPESIAALSGGKMTPDMVKMMSDMAKSMSPEDLQNMIEMTSTLRRQNQAPASISEDMDVRPPSNTVAHSSGSTSEENEISSAGFSSMPSLSSDMQEHVRKQMKDPAMRKMFSETIKNMSPEMMASMSEQFGFKLSPDEAVQAQRAMSTLCPDDLDRLMHWAERAQRLADYARKLKKWILGRPGLIFAIFMLVLAIILHRLGYIGN